MHDSKLLETIRALTIEEIKAFKDSPYYHDSRNRKEVILLFEWIVEDFPACSCMALVKEQTHAVIFPNKTFSENRLNHVMTTLLKLVEQFIISNYTQAQQEISRLLALSKFFVERNLHNRFELAYNQLSSLLQHQKSGDLDLVWEEYQLEYLRHLHSGMYNKYQHNDLNLKNTLDKLDVYYITQNLLLSSALISREQVVQLDISPSQTIYRMVNDIERFNNIVDNHPFLQLYVDLKPIISNEADLQYVIEYRNKVESIKDTLSIESLKYVFTATRNYLTMQYNKGIDEVLPFLFANLKEEFELGILKEQSGDYRASTIQNVVNVALKLKQYQWSELFIESCKDHITGTSHPEAVYAFIKANYCFHRKNYEHALETDFHQFRYDNFALTLAARRLEIKIWFEKGDYVYTEYRLNAFKSYLFANKQHISPQTYQNNNDFVDFLKKAISVVPMKDKNKLNILKDKIKIKYKSIAEREWIMDKING